MASKIRKSAKRRKVMGVALGATALTNAAAGFISLEGASAQAQSWIRMCVRDDQYRNSGATNSDVYVLNPSVASTPATSGCRASYLNANIPTNWNLVVGAQGPTGPTGPTGATGAKGATGATGP